MMRGCGLALSSTPSTTIRPESSGHRWLWYRQKPALSNVNAHSSPGSTPPLASN